MGILGSMERPLRLVLVRHGKSARNKAQGDAVLMSDEARLAVQGVSDAENPLTEEGWRQARETGAALRSRFGVPDCVYHSGYKRTAETTSGILEPYDASERARIDVRSSIFIRERDSGHTFNMTMEESDRAFPWLQAYWHLHGPFYARPPGGESLADVAARVYLFLDMLFRDREGNTVFAVTHGGTLFCFRFILERWGNEHIPASWKPSNCGVTVYDYSEEQRRLMLEEFNTVYWRR